MLKMKTSVNQIKTSGSSYQHIRSSRRGVSEMEDKTEDIVYLDNHQEKNINASEYNIQEL
jgi:hypothetical protein